jgi:putative ABC transport system permease protein
METAWQDIRQSLRSLLRQPAFAAVALLTLGLSTGVSAALFSVIDATLLNPLPSPHPEQLIDLRISHRRPDGRESDYAPSLADVRAWNAADSGVRHVAIERSVFPTGIFDAGVPERTESVKVSEEYFPLYGITPHLGRLFTAADTTWKAPGALLISYAFWHSRFGADPAVVGRVVRMDGQPAEIVGVLPRGFGDKMPLWRPLQVEPERVQNRGSGWSVHARLVGPLDAPSAAERLTGFLPVAKEGGDARARVRFILDEVRSDYRTIVTVLVSAVGVILLLACVNVGGLLLARGTARQAELAVRASMGASRGRLIRQVLTESLVLSTAGGLVGVTLAWLTLDMIVASLPIDLPDNAPMRISPFVLVAMLAATMVTGLLFGVIPALQLSRVRLGHVMARSGRHQASSLSLRGGQLLIAIEVALAVVMLAGAGLMIRSFSRLVSVDLGFDPARMLVVESEPVAPQHAVYASYYPALVEAVRRLPGVEYAGAGDSGPLGALGGLMMMSSVRKPDGKDEMAVIRTVSSGYVEALGIPVVAGRSLAPADESPGSGVLLINQAAARKWFGDGPAVGQWLEAGPGQTRSQIVGVVADIRAWGPRSTADEEVMLPYRPQEASKANPKYPPSPLILVVRPRDASRGLAEDLRRVATTVGPPVVFDAVRRGGDMFGETINRHRQRTVLLGLLGALGLTLALVGVIGMTAYAVGRRTQEIGVRLAFGAQPGQVVRAMLRDSAVPIVAGLVVGTGAALLSTKVIRTFLFETSPTDPATLAVVATLLGLVGCAAAWIPSRRAARVDPVETLRSE